MVVQVKPDSVTVRIPSKEGADIQKAQLARIYYLLRSHIRTRSGYRAELQFKKVMDKTFLAQDMSYEQIRGALESRLNFLLKEEERELIWIATSNS